MVKERLRNFIQQVNREQKVTVIFTTHDMVDIEKVCSRMMIIDHGQIVYDGSLDQIRERYGAYATDVCCYFPGFIPSDDDVTELVGALHAIGPRHLEQRGKPVHRS